jgi:hypothetical protein
MQLAPDAKGVVDGSKHGVVGAMRTIAAKGISRLFAGITPMMKVMPAVDVSKCQCVCPRCHLPTCTSPFPNALPSAFSVFAIYAPPTHPPARPPTAVSNGLLSSPVGLLHPYYASSVPINRFQLISPITHQRCRITCNLRYTLHWLSRSEPVSSSPARLR